MPSGPCSLPAARGHACLSSTRSLRRSRRPSESCKLLRAMAQDLSGVPDDPLAAVRARADENLYWRCLGVVVEDAKPGWVRLRVDVRDELRNAAGAPVHGGVMSALVDMAVGGALATVHEASAGGVGQTTLDLNVSFLAAATAGPIFAEGRILRRGRTIAFGEATITDGAGKVCAVGRATYMIVARSS